MQLSPAVKAQLQWWVKNIDRAYQPISHGKYHLLITTEASNLGRGAVCNDVTGLQLKPYNTNYLEMLAIFLRLKLSPWNTETYIYTYIYIRTMTDNTVAVSVLNQHGDKPFWLLQHATLGVDRYLKCAWKIKAFCWLSGAHIPGKQNKIASTESRESEIESKWMLDIETLNYSLNK